MCFFRSGGYTCPAVGIFQECHAERKEQKNHGWLKANDCNREPSTAHWEKREVTTREVVVRHREPAVRSREELLDCECHGKRARRVREEGQENGCRGEWSVPLLDWPALGQACMSGWRKKGRIRLAAEGHEHLWGFEVKRMTRGQVVERQTRYWSCPWMKGNSAGITKR
jgi:hypothetical protein